MKPIRQPDNALCPSSQDTLPSGQEFLFDCVETISAQQRADLPLDRALRIPIGKLAALGAGISSLLPPLRTLTQSTTFQTGGLYRLANAAAGDTLKQAKNGNYWGALRTAQNTSKFAQLQSVDPITVQSTTKLPLNPATAMMAATLFSIEQQLDQIAQTQTRILSFLEMEKESESEADIETLATIIQKYKYNWDNQYFVSSNHKLVLDIQRRAREHVHLYRKRIQRSVEEKGTAVQTLRPEEKIADLQKDFYRYRLALYTFSLASLLEVLLSGNFSEGNLAEIEQEINALSLDYRDLFSICSAFLERLAGHALGTQALSGIGKVSGTVGKFLGELPLIQKGPLDELLLQQGARLTKQANRMEETVIINFAALGNPETGVFVRKLEDLDRIYNRTAEICFDRDQLYFIQK